MAEYDEGRRLVAGEDFRSHLILSEAYGFEIETEKWFTYDSQLLPAPGPLSQEEEAGTECCPS
jgi:hypothetical protein